MVAMTIEDADAATIQGQIYQHVQVGSTIHTDEAAPYRGLNG